MKERRLKKWVLVVLWIVPLVILALVLMVYNRFYDKEIASCVKAGHSQFYCERGLQ